MRHRSLVRCGLSVLAMTFAACDDSTPATAPSTAAPAAVILTAPSTVAAADSSAASAPADTSTELVADLDVGDGRKMHLVCLGPSNADVPTILLEAGGGSPYSAWSDILDAMQHTRRVCAYDRAGVGASDAPPEASRTAADQVADLHRLLQAGDVHGPFVVGAHSYGATIAILFTQAYPDDVAGLVFVDPRGPRVSSGS